MSSQLPDRGNLRGLRSAYFLFRQWWILAPSVVATLVVGALFARTMIATGHTSLANVATLAAIAPLVGFGFGVMVGLPGFFGYRLLRTPARAWSPEPGETIEREMSANHFLGDEGRGGRITMTDRAVVFVPHRWNVQLAIVRIAQGAIVDASWGRIVGPTGLPISTVLELRTAAGATETFVVAKAASIAERLNRSIAESAPSSSSGTVRSK
jgi:hypothetical protein